MMEFEFDPQQSTVEKAIRVYQMLKASLAENDLTVDCQDDRLKICLPMTADGFRHQLHMHVSSQHSRVLWTSYYGFTVELHSESYRQILDALNRINQVLAVGAFAIDPQDGRIELNYSCSFLHAEVNGEELMHLTSILLGTAVRHVGRLHAIASGYLQSEQVLRQDSA
jgi:hypothetical protein